MTFRDMFGVAGACHNQAVLGHVPAMQSVEKMGEGKQFQGVDAAPPQWYPHQQFSEGQHMGLFVLTGPTASGKSAVALEIASRLDAEIVSADSMQVYRGMDVGTAKPTAAEREAVRHHLIDIRDTWESFSVGDFVRLADEVFADIHARGKAALVVGGTPMYLKGLVRGLFSGPPADWALRRELMGRTEREGVPALHAELARLDPAAAQRIHINDLRRIVRALEVHAKTGKPISEQQREWDGVFAKPGQTHSPARLAVGVILVRERADLCARIDERVVHMFRQGLVEEVRRLLASPEGMSRAARQALGYKEVIEHIEGKRSLEETVEMVKLRTRQFAKRQMTWLRSFKDFEWMEVSSTAPIHDIADRTLHVFGKNSLSFSARRCKKGE